MSMTSTQTWQPIETAPRDGTRILAWRPNWKESQAVVYWNSDFQDWETCLGTVFHDCTKWMPLPPPPSETDAPDSA